MKTVKVSFLKIIFFLSLFICKNVIHAKEITNNLDLEPSITNTLKKQKIISSSIPIYNLCAAVTHDLFQMDLLIKGNKSPHNYNLKPSDVKLINNVDIIIWGGENLEPHLKKLITTKKANKFKNNTLIININNAQNLIILPIRNLSNNKNNQKTNNCSSHNCNHHLHIDPHIWLSPKNAKKIAQHIMKKILEKFPQHKKEMEKNILDFEKKLTYIDLKNQNNLKKITNKNFLVFHDAYQYFENHYNLKNNKGAINLNPSIPLSAKNMKSIENKIITYKIKCVFKEPQFNSKIITILQKKFNLKEGSLNPLGEQKHLGKDGYIFLLKDLSSNFTNCLN